MPPSPAPDPGSHFPRPLPPAATGVGGFPVTAPVPRSWGRSLAALVGTTAFRQAAASVTALISVAALVMWLLYGTVNDIVARAVVETMTVEAQGLAEVARAGGTPALVAAVAAHRAADPTRLYLVEGIDGGKLAGNLARWPAEAWPAQGQRVDGHNDGGWASDRRPADGTGATAAPTAVPIGGTFHIVTGEPGDTARHLAAGVALSLPGGVRLLVARDIDDKRQLTASIKWLFGLGFGALALAGLAAGLVASRLALSRVAAITATTDTIMAGDFSGRIALSGAGDELDHLSANLNAMLERVELLMAGLREVSDNIAHDLKTPLTRLRGRAEAALRAADASAGGSTGQLRAALAEVIEDADELIKTFNALLLIARLEAGTLARSAETFDLGELVRDVAELYAPVVEEAGGHLACVVDGDVVLTANRQLVGQAIANLIDNAIKYGVPTVTDGGDASADPPSVEVRLRRRGAEAAVTVADRGPGIPAEDRERVLRRFVRLDASRTRTGTGLGLSLVAAVARLQGGRVELADTAPSSADAKGLAITLVLPCRA